MTDSSDRPAGDVSRRTFLGAVGVAALAIANPDFLLADAAPPPLAAEIPFSGDWAIQSSTSISEGGFALSQAGYAGENWTKVSVPTTVLAGLVASGQYPDLFHGDNLKQIRKSLFRVPWWYRKNFKLAPAQNGQQTWMYFKGINYRANLWLNGQQIGSSDQIAGAYRDVELNVSGALDPDGNNALAVEIIPPTKTDLGITFVDWAPAPPDQNMGIWQDVLLRTSGPVAVRNPHVIAEPELPGMRTATLTFMADLVNASNEPWQGVLTGFSEGIKFDQPVSLDPHERKTITFTPIVVRNPRIWWPWQLGKPELCHLTFQFHIGSRISDQCSTRYGIRKVTSRLKDGHLLFTVNGVDLLVLGGGYAPDLLQRRIMPDRPGWQEDHLRYVRDMNLNTVRLEGKLEDDAFFDLCDEHGILVMAGWCCCSAWEKWNDWREEHHLIARESLKYQIRKLRTHPSLLAWLNGSDNPPPPDVETAYLAIEADLQWPCPTISSASAAETSVTGASGVKMEGPYKWEPPIFWTTDTKTGGAWGFNTEVGPGAVPPPLETLEKILPPEHRWPIDSVWQFHCGGGSFAKLDSFNDPLDARYGKSKGIADYAWKSQAQAYETIRAMYEGFRANKWNATGEIQWMLNNAWPSMIWHLYDYYWRPGGAYFATKLACEPLHILYRYDNQAIVIANDTLSDLNGALASADIYDFSGKLLHHQDATCTAAANAATTAFTLPNAASLPLNTFLRLTLADSAKTPISVNSYWLSTKPDVLDWDNSDWNHTPCTSYADHTALEKLPPVNLTLDGFSVTHGDDEDSATVRVTNSGTAPAMMVRLKITKDTAGEELLPIRWQDNYFLLLPGEQRQIAARWLPGDAQGKTPAISVDCFNNGRA